MTTIDPAVKPDLGDKQSVLKRMDMATPPENHRLDGPEAFGHAYDIFTTGYDPALHAEMMPKPFFREYHRDIFIQVKNLKALVWAFEWLQQEYQ